MDAAVPPDAQEGHDGGVDAQEGARAPRSLLAALGEGGRGLGEPGGGAAAEEGGKEGWRERAGGSAQTAARVVPGRAGGRTCWSAVAAARFAPRPLRARGVPFAVADPREGPSAALG